MSGPVTADRLWGGRFVAGPAPELERLNRSLPVDRRLWPQDIAGSLAWAAALRQAEVLSAEQEAQLRVGLHRVAERLERWSEDDWSSATDEDIHTLVERLLREEVGPLAGRLHTGRSRNDQVATDARLWAMEAASELHTRLRDLMNALLAQAESHIGTIMPAYTHLQRAQPVSAAHWLLSHLWPLARDRERLTDACNRAASLPLGSGAVAGCAYPVDRVLLKEVLGFRTVSENSMDATADRDWVAELLFVAALIGTHLSRLAEDLVVFSSTEFGLVRLPERFSTGSSLMPQKRNPDAMELARGKSGRLIGDLTAFLAVLKSLPSGYSKDLQEDKSLLFDAFDTLDALLPAVTGTVAGMGFDERRCAAAVDSAMLTTDLADALVREGVPFREAHEQVGRLVRAAEELGCPVDALPRDVVASVSERLARLPLSGILDARASVAAKSAAGGTSEAAVRRQLERARIVAV